MKKRNRIIVIIAVVSVMILLAGFYYVQVNGNRTQAYKTAELTINQLKMIIDRNAQQEESLTESLKEDYITRAKAAAYIIDQNPSTVTDTNELNKIAKLISVDEIYLFDTGGTIYAGTIKEYIGFSFDSGEQMAFFKPMLTDKNLTLCQDVTPNTAEGKLMMYAMTWNEAGTRLVQIGIAPVRLLAELKANNINSIVEGMGTNSGMEIVAVDKETNKVAGATNPSRIGIVIEDLGVDVNTIEEGGSASFEMNIEGTPCYCVLADYEDYYLGVAMTKKSVNQGVPRNVLMMVIYMAIAALVIVCVINRMSDEVSREHKTANTDELTGFHNRHSYESECRQMVEEGKAKNLIYLSMDLNGLKTVNDNMGHEAGDKLIKGAAETMRTAFSEYGDLYRIGGDEFVAVIKAEATDVERLLADFKAMNEAWSKENGITLAVSCGHVFFRDHPGQSLDEIARIADKLMYEDKRAYYRQSGHDRRK